jgi:hypothetical protein
MRKIECKNAKAPDSLRPHVGGENPIYYTIALRGVRVIVSA